MEKVNKLTDWIGRTTESTCWLDPWRAQAMHATLDARDAPPRAGDALPACWHWLYFLDAAPSRELGTDGHPARGGFLPPVPLPRRMWAGSRLEFLAPVALGSTVRKVSRVVAVEEKAGRSGRLCFVTVEHETFAAVDLAIRERQDIVYREASRESQQVRAEAAPSGANWERTWTLDAPRLFRYSALTFNSHRIHYDRNYAMNEEGYPGLVVQGPLLAMLMLELVRERWPARRIATFEFRALAPLFDDGKPVRVCAAAEAERVALWVADADGGLHTRGTVTVSA
jgi:3-methylfumaryl-CoA hydratase